MINRRQRNLALLVAGCFFMENLDGTIVTTAAPRIGHALGAPPSAIGLVITAYLLTLAVLIPISGWLASRLGTRRVFLTAIAIFTLASFGCAMSRSLPMLVGLRVLQGVGGAMMVPVGRMVVLNRADKRDLLRIMSYIVWPGLLSPVMAPLAGALITTYASWPWLFLINVPLGCLAFAVAWRLLDPGHAGTPAPPDWRGLLFTCTGLGAVTYAASLVGTAGSSPALIAALVLGGGALLALAGWQLLRAEHPLIDLRTLRVPTFRLAQLGGSLFWIVVGAGPFLLPLRLELGFGWGALQAASLVLFIFVGNVGIKPLTTPLINRVGFRPLLLVSTLGLGASMVGLGLVQPSTPPAVMAALALLAGVFRSAGLTCYSTIALVDIPASRMRDANTLAATTQQLSAGLAIAAATVALRAGDPISRALHLPDPHSAAYSVAFVLIGLTALLATAEALRLHRGAGDVARRRGAAEEPAPGS